jgi:hypothetical protein
MNDPDQLKHLLAQQRRLARRVNLLFAVSLVATLLAVMGLVGWSRAAFLSPERDGVLHVRGVAVADGNGKVRVRLQAPLPDPVIMGRQVKRDNNETASGVMIYDSLGNERGGYVTDNSVGNAFLSLDSNTGQEVTVVAYPNGGAAFVINDDQKDKVFAEAMPGKSRLVVMKGGQPVYTLPPATTRP